MEFDETVAVSLKGQSQHHVAIFVASCAERMVQLFTGLLGADSRRISDVDTVVRLQGMLWDMDAPADSFQAHVTSLDGFQELLPSDEEISDVVGIYSFYSVLSLRYAALYRASGQVEDALKCAHACLTGMGQLDQNLPESLHFAHEGDLQQQTVFMPQLEATNSAVLSRLKERDRAVGRKRLEAIRNRMER
ncbi:hypothetical protein ACFY78_21525 [Streptomyces olindensis]|uniref:hypothetical protein n=1 Tax=Streptomyces olindensis TaxID=358823 RepID=UPI0036A2DD49